MKENKHSFVFGLVSGVAVLAVIGFFVMMFMYLGDKTSSNVAGGQKVAESQQAETGDGQQVAEVNPEDVYSGRFRGGENAKVVIVEYSDFQCPFCSRFHETMKQVMNKYGDKVKWVYKHFPLDSIHPLARKAAEASECAGDQGKFWEMSDSLIENQSSLSQNKIEQIAGGLGLNMQQYSSCVESRKYKDKVEADYQQGISIGVTGTPGGFINNVRLPGALPFEDLSQAIDQMLAE